MNENDLYAYLQQQLGTAQPDLFSPAGVGQAVQSIDPKKTSQLYNQMVLKSLQDRDSEVKKYEEMLNKQKQEAPVSTVAAISAGANDLFNNTNSLQNLAAQKQQADRGLASQEMALQGLKAGLTKDQIGVLGKQLDAQNDAEKLKMSMATKDKRADDKDIQIESALFKDWSNNPTTKGSQDVATAYEKVNSAAQIPSAAGDLSLIFGYMKMLDPGSTVREGEFATAQNAGSVGDSIKNLYNKAISGQRLTESQRKDFVSKAQGVFTSQLAQQKRYDETVKARAKNLGLDPSRVVYGETLFGENYNKKPEQIKTPPVAPKFEDPKFLEWKKSKGMLK